MIKNNSGNLAKKVLEDVSAKIWNSCFQAVNSESEYKLRTTFVIQFMFLVETLNTEHKLVNR